MKKLLTIFLTALVATATAHASPCDRIISLAPSITEVLYALELEDKLVGVSRFSDYPPAAQSKPRVGGFIDPNYEVIVASRPSIVLLLEEHRESKIKLETLKLSTMTLEHRSIDGILTSIVQIGRLCGTEDQAKALQSELSLRVNQITTCLKDVTPIKTLVVVSSSGEGDILKSVYISGIDGYFSDILKLTGGAAVYSGLTTGFPVLSAEGVLKLAPQAVIHIAYGMTDKERDNIKRAWSKLSDLPAVKNDRIFILTEDYATIPGPRFVLLMDSVGRLLHQKEYIECFG